jgi:hypothetical protein
VAPIFMNNLGEIYMDLMFVVNNRVIEFEYARGCYIALTTLVQYNVGILLYHLQ